MAPTSTADRMKPFTTLPEVVGKEGGREGGRDERIVGGKGGREGGRGKTRVGGKEGGEGREENEDVPGVYSAPLMVLASLASRRVSEVMKTVGRKGPRKACGWNRSYFPDRGEEVEMDSWACMRPDMVLPGKEGGREE